jgi:hypothetical protein
VLGYEVTEGVPGVCTGFAMTCGILTKFESLRLCRSDAEL